MSEVAYPEEDQEIIAYTKTEIYPLLDELLNFAVTALHFNQAEWDFDEKLANAIKKHPAIRGLDALFVHYDKMCEYVKTICNALEPKYVYFVGLSKHNN